MSAFKVTLVSLLLSSQLGLSSKAQEEIQSSDSELGYSYTLESTVIMAIENDPWLKKSQYKEQSLLAQAESQATLPDPKVSVKFANLPVDSFSFNQEGMTQLSLGVSQMLARGDSLNIKRKINQLEAKIEPNLRANRKNQLIMTVGDLWLDIYKAQQSIQLINQLDSLLEELKEAAEIQYNTALSSTGQEDIIRAQLELAKLDDQLTVYQDKLHASINQLNQYVTLPQGYLFGAQNVDYHFVSQTLPSIQLPKNLTKLQRHPLVLAADRNIHLSAKNVELKKQGYKPQFTLNGSYALRDDAPNGMKRTDFFSLGVTFDVPLFTENKQDLDVKSAVYTKEAKREEKALLLRQLRSAYNTQLSRLGRLEQRKELYQGTIAPQVSQQATTLMTAYSNNKGDFAELARSRVEEINVQLTILDIDVEIAKSKLAANYYLSETSTEYLSRIGSINNTSARKALSGESHE
ncbi:TolC family protein [Kangiella spongicola]|uniref:Transporter n=1 Tax=Kangiella spongicola TaxID=796379 RepID=A0A318D0M4_9GAMM|nr:TolC family protein [Kangiella spongicola]PXF62756.1 transporter [Kangiella spongicola]